MNLVDELQAIAGALERSHVPYALCGGIAVTVHGATRTTKGIDLLVRRADLPRILDVVRPLGFTFVALPMTFEKGTPRERHLQRVTKIQGPDQLILDLMLDEAALVGFLDSAIRIDLPEGPLQVVSREALIEMKRLAARKQDLADIEKLEADREA